jgi:hypothetical protein
MLSLNSARNAARIRAPNGEASAFRFLSATVKKEAFLSTPTQIAANKANAQNSTGPKTETGKSVSSLNNFRHGFAGNFKVLPTENQDEFDLLLSELADEHQPATTSEKLLVEKMAQHYWLSRRALTLQDTALTSGLEKHLALYLRYQTTHDRAFHKCLGDLLKLRTEKRKQDIGFESQKQKEAERVRKQEMHETRIRAINAKTDEREVDNDIRQTIEAPLPGNVRLPFDTLKDVFRIAAYEVNRQLKSDQAA